MNQPVRRHVFYGLSMHFPRCRLCISPRDWCALRLVGSSVKIIWVKAGEPFAGCDLFVYCNLIFFHKNPRRNWLGQYPECIQQISRKGQEGLDVLHLYNQRGDDFLCPQRCHVLPKCAVPLEPEEGNNKCWTRRHVVGFTNWYCCWSWKHYVMSVSRVSSYCFWFCKNCVAWACPFIFFHPGWEKGISHPSFSGVRFILVWSILIES